MDAVEEDQGVFELLLLVLWRLLTVEGIMDARIALSPYCLISVDTRWPSLPSC